MKLFDVVSRHVWFFVCSVLIVPFSAAAQGPSRVEVLLNRGNWKDASRQIFLEARTANKYQWSLPVGQAKAGFLEDALETINGMHPKSQPEALLELVENVPSLGSSRSAEIVIQALELARKSTGISDVAFTAGSLARIALFYSRQGAIADAKAIFDESLNAAEIGMADNDSNGYRRVSEAIAGNAKSSQDWMVGRVVARLQRQGPTENTAFTYLDLV